MRLDGKVALITGGGTGIGAATAERFVSEGARVCIAGRRRELLDRVAGSLPPRSVETCAGDVSNQADAIRMVEAAVSFGGRLDILVNNAAMDQAPANAIDIDPAVFRRILDVNIAGPLLLMKAAVPEMIRAGGGSIINVASLAGLRAIPDMPAYCASKGGLIMLTQQVALDFGRYNVRCNVICPGATRTEMFEGGVSHFTQRLGTDIEGVFKHFTKGTPMRRVAAPVEIAAVCCCLAGDDSTFLTGAVIPVDGGAAIVDVSGAALSDMG